MKTFAIASVIALATVASAQLDNIPSCALSCFITPLSTDGCSSITDFKCHCQKGSSLLATVQPCVQGACPAADQASTIAAVQKTCQDAGVPINIPGAQASASSAVASASAALSSAVASAVSSKAAAASSVASSASAAVSSAAAAASSAAAAASSVAASAASKASSAAGSATSAAASAKSSAAAAASTFTGGAPQATKAAGIIGAAALAMLAL